MSLPQVVGIADFGIDEEAYLKQIEDIRYRLTVSSALPEIITFYKSAPEIREARLRLLQQELGNFGEFSEFLRQPYSFYALSVPMGEPICAYVSRETAQSLGAQVSARDLWLVTVSPEDIAGFNPKYHEIYLLCDPSVLIVSPEPYTHARKVSIAAVTATALKGGLGSGNYGHAGRPGKVGGSAPSGTFLGRVGERMSRYVRFFGKEPTRGKALQILRTAEAGIDLISSVHGVSGLEPIPLEFNYSSSEALFAKTQREERPMGIRLSKKTSESLVGEENIVHECGHYLDAGISYAGRNGKISLEQKRIFEEHKHVLDKMLYETPYIRNLIQLAKDTSPQQLPITYMGKSRWRHAYEGQEYIFYLGSRVECFARAYCQYISVRCTNNASAERLREQIHQGQKPFSISYSRDERRLEARYPRYWSDEEFEPIAKEFDSMFEDMGWKTPE